MSPDHLVRTRAGVSERFCRRGEHWVPWTLEYFGRDHHGGNGLTTVCKACRQAARRLLGEPHHKSMLPEPYRDLEQATSGWGK